MARLIYEVVIPFVSGINSTDLYVYFIKLIKKVVVIPFVSGINSTMDLFHNFMQLDKVVIPFVSGINSTANNSVRRLTAWWVVIPFVSGINSTVLSCLKMQRLTLASS